MITGTTSNGFEYKIDENALKDWDYVDLVLRMNRTDDDLERVECLKDVIKIIFPGEEMERLKTFLKEKNNGYAPIDEISNMYKEITESIADQNKEIKK